ncbi:MAG: DUF742 domain-containing protein [Pseudonocardia sp.]|nr:DUF742 domain-containing protein [Pseudonocardia sp.]
MTEQDRPDARRPGPGTARSPVRPYTLTRGRTASREALPPETVVVAADDAPGTDTGRGPSLTPEGSAIVDLCRPWCSVAELSALLHLPLGVVRVLIEDLDDAGRVHVHPPSPAHGEDTDQLERALRELRKRI